MENKLNASPSRKKNRGLTQEAFDSLLAHLDPDKERAGQEYLKLRRKVVVFFECRGCLHAEDHADETINRLAIKYTEGATIQDPHTYCFGVARMIYLEILKRREKERLMLNQVSLLQPTDEEDEAFDPRVDCFEDCLSKLSHESRNMMIGYYQGEKHARIENRKNLAERMGIPLNSLRIRAYRIRAGLEECIRECMEEKSRL
jgi:DNA-directed RNA polymerase specialized sigma24 family protein